MSLTITVQSFANLGVTTGSPATITLNTGIPGPQGTPGSSGAAATIAVGTTTTLPAGSSATVSNSGTSSAAVFNFAIPQGAQGIQGIQGIQGPQGPAGINTWGSITGTLSSQTDLQTALNGKYSTSNPAGYITSAALSGYATQSYVTSQGYITSSALSPYLTSSVAASTYQTLAGMSSYLTTSAASSTYLTKVDALSHYLGGQNGTPTGNAGSATIYPATGAYDYAQYKGNGVQFYLNDAYKYGIDQNGVKFSDGTVQTSAGVSLAPNDGNYYIQQSGNWIQLIVS